MEKKRVLVFGVFDLLHPGHESFLRQARRKGSELFVVVARDATVKRLKGIVPRRDERRRAAAVRRISYVTRAVLGDRSEGSYAVLRRYKPDVICVGYDQEMLRKDLLLRMETGEVRKIPIVQLQPFMPRRYRSSLLRMS